MVGNTAFTTPSGLAKARFTFGEMGDQSLTFSVSRTVADDKDVPYDQFATTGGSFGNVDRLTDTTQASVEYGYNPLGNDLVDFTANLSYAIRRSNMTMCRGLRHWKARRASLSLWAR